MKPTFDRISLTLCLVGLTVLCAVAAWPNELQDRVDALSPGEWLQVAPGNYPDRLLVRQNNVTIYAEAFREAHVGGITILGTAVTVSGLDIASTTGNGLLVYGSGARLLDNRVHDCGDVGIAWNWKPSQWVSSGYARGNVIERCNGGFAVSGRNIIIEENEVRQLVQRLGGHDVDYCRAFGENVVIRNNVFHETRLADVGNAHVDGLQSYDNNGQTLTGLIFTGNIVRDCHQGVFLEAKTTTGSHRSLIIRGNTFAPFPGTNATGITTYGGLEVGVEGNVFLDWQNLCVRFRPGAQPSTGAVIGNVWVNCKAAVYVAPGCDVTVKDNRHASEPPPAPIPTPVATVEPTPEPEAPTVRLPSRGVIYLGDMRIRYEVE